MAVSKAPAPPPGLEQQAPGGHMAQNLQAYAMQRPWTPMGGVPSPMPMDPSMAQNWAPTPGGYYPAGGPAYNGKMNAAAKAALNLFQAGPGNEERQRAELAAKANARRLLNSPLHKAKAGNVQPPSATNGGENTATPNVRTPPSGPSRDEPPQVSQSQSASSGGPRYTGVLKVFKPESGYGFIDCEELRKMYGCDVFMNQGIEGGIVVGGQVSFTLELNKSGKPQARDARLEVEKSDAPEEPGPRGSDLLGKVFKGTVKSFNVARGFGFLTCAELSGSKFGGRDVYVNLGQVPDQRPLTTGHEVEFTLSVNQQGQPQAKDLKLMNTSPELDYLGELPTAQSVGDKLLRMS